MLLFVSFGDLIFKDSISHGTIQSTVQCFPCSTLLPFSAIKLLHTNFSKHFNVKTQQIVLLRLTGSPRVWWYVCTITATEFWPSLVIPLTWDVKRPLLIRNLTFYYYKTCHFDADWLARKRASSFRAILEQGYYPHFIEIGYW
jgi:hypothetical protein